MAAVPVPVMIVAMPVPVAARQNDWHDKLKMLKGPLLEGG